MNLQFGFNCEQQYATAGIILKGEFWIRLLFIVVSVCKQAMATGGLAGNRLKLGTGS